MSNIDRQIPTTEQPLVDIYGGSDPREIPAYRVTDAASYLGLPVTTLRAWSRGMNYRHKDGSKGYFKPVFSLPDSERSLLSYLNLVEAFVLSSLRRKHMKAEEEAAMIVAALPKMLSHSQGEPAA